MCVFKLFDMICLAMMWILKRSRYCLQYRRKRNVFYLYNKIWLHYFYLHVNTSTLVIEFIRTCTRDWKQKLFLFYLINLNEKSLLNSNMSWCFMPSQPLFTKTLYKSVSVFPPVSLSMQITNVHMSKNVNTNMSENLILWSLIQI